MVVGTIALFRPGGPDPRPGLHRARARPRRHHAALGGFADHDGRRLALGAERPERPAQRHAAGASPDPTSRSCGSARSLDLAFATEIVIGILVSIPFCTSIFLGGLASIPGDIYEAAALEGAGGWTQFRTLTLPLMRPFITIALILNIIYVFNSFPIIWVMTQGGPANGTDILVTYLYKLAFVFGRLGDAAAVSLLMFGALLILTTRLPRPRRPTVDRWLTAAASPLQPALLGAFAAAGGAEPVPLRGDAVHGAEAGERGGVGRRRLAAKRTSPGGTSWRCGRSPASAGRWPTA